MIREARAADRGRVLMMARSFHDQAGLPFAFSAPTADMIFQASLMDDDRICLVYDVEGFAAGAIVAHAAHYHLAPIKVAQEIMWWIDPDYRGQAASRMLRAYEAWARSRGCAFVHMVGLGGDPAVTRLYERNGFSPAERHFLKPLKA